MIPPKKIFKYSLFLIVPAILFFSSCSLATMGKVTDKDTGQPIKGAVVAISWDTVLVTPAGGVTRFLAVKETLTDKEGRFFLFTLRFHLHIPFITWIVQNEPIIYKPGYYFFVKDKHTSDIKLKRIPSTSEARGAELKEIDHHYETNRYTTKLFNLMVERENEFLQQTPSDFRLSPPNDWRRIVRQRIEEARIKNAAIINKKPDYDPEKVKILENDLQSPDRQIRVKAIMSLAETRDSRVFEPLTSILVSEKDDYVRGFVTAFLYYIKDPKTLETIINALKDPGLRGGAVMSLTMLGDPSGIDPLIETLNDSNEGIRNGARLALMQIGDPAIEPLIHALKSDFWKIRSSAAEALWYIGDERMVEPLIEASKDKNSRVLWDVSTALGVFKNPTATDALILMLDNSDFELRRRVVSSLGNLQDQRALEPVLKMLSDPSRWVRISTVNALGQMHSKEAITGLIKAWNDQDQEVRTIAANILGQMGPLVVDPLIAELNNTDSYFRWRAARALGQIRDIRAVEGLILLLNDEVSEVRWSAIEALGRIKDTKALAPIQTLIMDGDTGISLKAREAIANINSPPVPEPVETEPVEAQPLKRIELPKSNITISPEISYPTPGMSQRLNKSSQWQFLDMGKQCCSISAIDSTKGIITAREDATGKTFYFKTLIRGASTFFGPSPGALMFLESLKIGQPVSADFTSRKVSLNEAPPLNGSQYCCYIVEPNSNTTNHKFP